MGQHPRIAAFISGRDHALALFLALLRHPRYVLRSPRCRSDVPTAIDLALGLSPLLIKAEMPAVGQVPTSIEFQIIATHLA